MNKLLAILLLSLSVSAQTTAPTSTALSNADVLRMLRAGLGEDTILLAVQQAPSPKLDTSPDALIELKEAGASDKLLNALLTVAGSGVEGYISCDTGAMFAALFSTGDPATLSVISHIHCRESVTILGERVNQFRKIRSKEGQVGYVNSQLLREGTPPPLAVTTQPTPSQSSPAPSVQPTSAPSNRILPASNVPGYPMTLRVLQTQSIPYNVQIGGGSSNTNCSISGTTYTTGSASTYGNTTYGNATSNTNLGMHCNSYQTAPTQWRR